MTIARPMPPKINLSAMSPLEAISSANNGIIDGNAFLRNSRIILPMKNRIAKGDVRFQTPDSADFDNGSDLAENEFPQIFSDVLAQPIDLQVATGPTGRK